jgi:signal transduction histidine kinase
MSEIGLRPDAVAVGVFDGGRRLVSQTAGLAAVLELKEIAIGRDMASLLAHLACPPPDPPFSLQCRTGGGRLLQADAQPLSGGGWMLAVADITAVLTAAEALGVARRNVESAAEAKARFLAAMNHELRTPLNAVIGFAETLAYHASRNDAAPDPRQTEEFAMHILGAGRQLLGLIDDMLDVVRIDAGTSDLAADTVEVGRLIEAALAAVGPAARRGGVGLSGRDLSGTARISADERRLRRLLAHLLGLAVRSTGPGGAIEVTAALDAGDLVIAVRDNGSGLAPEELERARQPLEKLEPRPSRRGGGAGIGLQLARAIAEAHGGTLALESRPGEGTTATVRLPGTRRLDASLSAHLAEERP